MESILVLAPHEDRAGRAITLAQELALRSGARLTLLRVLEENVGTMSPVEGASGALSVRDLLLDIETRQVEALASGLRDALGREVAVRVQWGVPWEAVIDLVERDGHDLVVKPASGLARGGHVFFGSTALHLFRRCPCPVWVVGDEGRLPSKIVAAIDPSGAESRRRTAANILGWAERIGAWSEAPVHVATAWHATGSELLQRVVPEPDWKRYVSDARERARSDLRELLASAAPALPDERMALVEGPARDALPRFVADCEFDLIVMGTLGRHGVVGDLLGETAETIIREVRSSVLTIPPRRDA